MDALTPEERHSVYKMLRLEVLVHPDETLEVSGAFGQDPTFSHLDLIPAGQVYLIREPPPYGSREAVYEQHDDDHCSCQRCHLRVVEEVQGDGDLLPNTPGPDKSKYVAERMLHSYWYNASEVKELMAWGSRPTRKL